jgi:stage II sporulation protein P
LRKTGRNAQHVSFRKPPLAVQGLALIFVLYVFVRLISAFGAGSAGKNMLSRFVSNEGAVRAVLNSELGSAAQSEQRVPLISLILDPSLLSSVVPSAVAAAPSSIESPDSAASDGGASTGSVSPGSGAPGSGTPTSSAPAVSSAEPWLFYMWNSSGSPAVTPNIITKPAQATSADAIAVDNKTDYAVDTAALLKQQLKISLAPGKPAVLIIHTHGSEAYMPDGKDQYVESDPYRTQDMSQTVMHIGDALAEAFENAGISVIHDTGIYDYPSYQASYSNSYAAIQSILKKYPSIKIVIDVHRDHIEDKDGNVYKTFAQFGDTTCAQVKFVMGTSYSGLKHPNWTENLKLALQIQQEMNTLYPTLAKPIELSQYRYNQQATTGSMIVEVGCTGNTLQESLTAIQHFADAASKVLHDLY